MFEVDIDVKIDFDEPTVRKLARDLAVKPLVACGALVEGEAKRLMKKGGRRKTKKGKWRGIPSTPPNPPHVQQGILRSSITHALTPEGSVIVGPTRIAWYGRLHEFGGRHHPMRPFMHPALANARSKFADKFKEINLAATPAGRRLNAKGGA